MLKNTPYLPLIDQEIQVMDSNLQVVSDDSELEEQFYSLTHIEESFFQTDNCQCQNEPQEADNEKKCASSNCPGNLDQVDQYSITRIPEQMPFDEECGDRAYENDPGSQEKLALDYTPKISRTQSGKC